MTNTDPASLPLPVTNEAVVARQARVMDQLPPLPGAPRALYAPVAVAPPEWWAEACVPLDGVGR